MASRLLLVRELSREEEAKLQRLINSRTEAAGLVKRAQIVWSSHEGRKVEEIMEELHLARNTVRKWIKQFNVRGMAGLADEPRPGRPATYTAEQVGEVIATALTNPAALELPFATWTLDRLEAYLNEEKGIPIKRSRIDDLLRAEGLRRRKQESWFSERVDPAFAEKRGHHAALHRTARRQRSRMPGRNGAGSGQELCRACVGWPNRRR